MNSNHNPKKSLGQNFLIDDNIINNIVKSGNFQKSDIVVEIGSGRGALTKKIYKKVKNLIIVEKDLSLVKELKEQFKDAIIFNDDFLKWNLPEEFRESKIKIIGNLPYNIASQIIFKVLEEHFLYSLGIFMVQKEVGDRIIAKKGGRDYSLLSVVCQTFANIQRLFNVSPNCFYPKPKVFSSVIKFEINNRFDIDDFVKFFNFVKSIFYGRRKIFLNILKNNPYLNFRDEFIFFVKKEYGTNIRIANLSLEDIIKLYRRFCEVS